MGSWPSSASAGKADPEGAAIGWGRGWGCWLSQPIPAQPRGCLHPNPTGVFRMWLLCNLNSILAYSCQYTHIPGWEIRAEGQTCSAVGCDESELNAKQERALPERPLQLPVWFAPSTPSPWEHSSSWEWQAVGGLEEQSGEQRQEPGQRGKQDSPGKELLARGRTAS